MRPSPRRGGGNLCARNWVGPVPPGAGDAGGPVPPGAGEASPAPGGTGPTQFRLYERTYPPYIYKGGSDDPLYIYIYKGIVRSYEFLE